MKLLNFYKNNHIVFTIRISGSCMSPILKDGEFVRVHPCEKYDIGDIVLCSDTKGILYIHRIHKIVGNKYITKADNNLGEDADPISYNMVFGKVLVK